jgi:Gpi18-like mannosyltransferase
MILAFFPGFYPDTNHMINYVAHAQHSGVTSVADFYEHTLYPPLFVYQAVIASKAVSVLARQPISAPDSPDSSITVWDRLGVRIIPILSDIIIACLLFIFISPKTGRSSALIGCSLYLFNPGTIANSALWNYDSLPSFLILLTVILVGVAFDRQRHGWLIFASAVFALAFCTKLQAAMFLPALAAFLLFTKNPKTIITAAAVFLLVTLLAYAPFLLQGKWDYLRKVFIVAFEDYPTTHVNGYNVWALGYQMPVTRKLFGVTFENIGRLAYLGTLFFSLYALTKGNISNGMRPDMRQIVILGAYLCLAPFLVLTRMHERYLAPAIAITILAGFIDRRLRIVAWAFALTYGLNLVAFLLKWILASPDEELSKPVHFAFVLSRIFGSLTNVLLFGWFTLKLRSLFSTAPALVVASSPTPEQLGVSAGYQAG